MVPPSLALHGHGHVAAGTLGSLPSSPMQGFCAGVLLGGSGVILDSVVDFRPSSLPRLRDSRGLCSSPPGL